MFFLRRTIKKFFRPKANEHEPDRVLLFTMGILLLIGLIMLSSASSVVSYTKFGSTYYYFFHQLFGLFLGLIVFVLCSNIDYRYWRKYALFFLVCSVGLLLLVFIPGLSANYGKARSWINVFGFSLQPSEFVKISFLLYLAAWLENKEKKLHDFHQGIGPFVFILGVLAFLMLLQPDLGTLIILTIISLIVYFVGGGKKSHILIVILGGLAALAIMVNLRSYQMNRFKCMIDPDIGSRDACYQVHQSKIAVGSGGIWGRGLGQSRQKFLYLPEVSGDSIFAVIAEETGFLFSSFLVIIYLVIFYRGFLISKNAPDVFGRILAIGIVSWIVVQAIINIGGMVNLMPMTGVPLPFISYGGSAILSALAAMGILINISKQTRIK